MDGETLQQKKIHKGSKNKQLQDLQRQDGGGELVWDISQQIQGTTLHHGAKPKVVRHIVFFICGVATTC